MLCPLAKQVVELNCSDEDLGDWRRYLIDLSGPRAVFAGGHLVNTLLKSSAQHYMEFKAIGVDDRPMYTSVCVCVRTTLVAVFVILEGSLGQRFGLSLARECLQKAWKSCENKAWKRCLGRVQKFSERIF